MEKLKEEPITVSEVKEILLKKVKDLDQFQQRTLDFAKKASKLDAEKARQLVGELVDKFGISKEEAVQVVNSLPSSLEELKVFFLTSRTKALLAPRLEEMAELISKYLEQ